MDWLMQYIKDAGILERLEELEKRVSLLETRLEALERKD